MFSRSDQIEKFQLYEILQNIWQKIVDSFARLLVLTYWGKLKYLRILNLRGGKANIWKSCSNICRDIWNCIWENVGIKIFSVNRLNWYWHKIHSRKTFALHEVGKWQWLRQWTLMTLVMIMITLNDGIFKTLIMMMMMVKDSCARHLTWALGPLMRYRLFSPC